jgi:hypothetical protein
MTVLSNSSNQLHTQFIGILLGLRHAEAILRVK